MLVLFDIDGTLLHAHGIGRRAIETALSAAAGRPVLASGVPFAGRTDPAIARDMLTHSGVSVTELEDILADGLHRYLTIVEEALEREPVTVLPGVTALLDRLAAEESIQLALLTGNLQPSAFAKLRAGGLAGHFTFGAFGSDDPDRFRLPAVAQRRAREHTGRSYEPWEAVIVGDTEHDVGCGRHAGMHTVGVCTGPHEREVMAAFAPDLLLDDLSQSEGLLRLLALSGQT